MAMKVKNTWKPYITAQEHKRLKNQLFRKFYYDLFVNKEVKSTTKKVI